MLVKKQEIKYFCYMNKECLQKMATEKQFNYVPGQIYINDQGCSATLSIDKRIFSDTIISSVCTCLLNIYFFNIYIEENNNEDNKLLVLTMERKDGKKLTEAEIKTFLNELFCQKTRFELQSQFGRLRDRIVDYAFAPLEKGDV